VTGTTTAGVTAAVDAFLQYQLVAGVIGLPGWKRSSESLLDCDPLPLSGGPTWVPPERMASWERLAVVPGSADEYQGVFADCGARPVAIWRWKYHQPGAWDEPGMFHAIRQYLNGLHRRAYGSTWWTAKFSSEAIAEKALPLLAKATGMGPKQSWYEGQVREVPMGKFGPEPGYDLTMWRNGSSLHLCNLPRQESQLRTILAQGK